MLLLDNMRWIAYPELLPGFRLAGKTKIMDPYHLQLGIWEAALYASTPSVERPVRQFGNLFSGSRFCVPGSGKKYQQLIIVNPSVLEITCPTWFTGSLQNWAKFNRAWSTAYKKYCSIRVINHNPEPELNDLFTFSWPQSIWKTMEVRGFLPNREEPGQFFVLVLEQPDEYSYLKIFKFSLFLATSQHIVRGGLCLHSSAVAQGNTGFLFLGDSTAGKTTVARLSASVGYPALGDDLNFIIRNDENDYLLAAAPSPILSPVGYSLERPPLRGIFTLLQDDKDSLVPLSPKQTALALFNSFKQTPKTQMLPNKMIGLGFRTCCDIARRTPGYELHFRKSPEFWKLINEQFPA